MTDVYAAWAAAHALLLFILLPLLSGAGALLFARCCLGLSRRGRGLCFALGIGASFAVFLALAIAVGSQGAVVEFDRALAGSLSMSMSMPLLWLLSWFTYLGDRNFLTGISVLMTLYLLWNRQWRLAAFCAITTGAGGALNWVLKQNFERLRPEHDHGYASAAGWSFPSGHSSASMAVYGTACYLLWRLAPPSWRLPGIAVLAALIVAIGLSRILLQVHFASDVIAGFSVSLGWLALCVAAERGLRASGERGERLQ